MTAAARDAADWRLRAACRGQDTNQWFGRPHETTHAVTICARCPVRAECLHECMQTEVPTYRYGVYGGLTAAQRRALPAGDQDMTIAALRRLLNEIDEQGDPEAARQGRLQLPDEPPHERTEPMTHPNPTAPAPVVDVKLKTAAEVRLKPVIEIDTPQVDTESIPVGQLLKWAADHSDPEVQFQAERAHEALTSLRARHATDQELTAITDEAAQLEKRLAELRAREAELAPAPKRKRSSYVRDYDTREVRAWADANGIDCPRVGQLPKRVLDAWRTANGSTS